MIWPRGSVGFAGLLAADFPPGSQVCSLLGAGGSETLAPLPFVFGLLQSPVRVTRADPHRTAAGHCTPSPCGARCPFCPEGGPRAARAPRVRPRGCGSGEPPTARFPLRSASLAPRRPLCSRAGAAQTLPISPHSRRLAALPLVPLVSVPPAPGLSASLGPAPCSKAGRPLL